MYIYRYIYNYICVHISECEIMNIKQDIRSSFLCSQRISLNFYILLSRENRAVIIIFWYCQSSTHKLRTQRKIERKFGIFLLRR